MHAIRTEGLSKTYRGRFGRTETAALQALSLEVRQGEVFGLLGPNGAGKTSTIHLLLNFIRPTSGSAFLFDRPVSDVESHRRLGYVPEAMHLHDYYSGERLLDFYGRLHGLAADKRRARADELLELVDLKDAAKKRVAKYSKGMAQRLGIAQALIHDPDVLIFDEPTASLDPVGRQLFREVLLRLKHRGKTVLMCSHILSEVESVCDRVGILDKGTLKRVGTLAELSVSKSTRIVVRDLPGELMPELAATSAEVTWSHGEATIRCKSDVIRRDVESLLHTHGVAVTRVEAEAQSLDEIFFSSIREPLAA